MWWKIVEYSRYLNRILSVCERMTVNHNFKKKMQCQYNGYNNCIKHNNKIPKTIFRTANMPTI